MFIYIDQLNSNIVNQDKFLKIFEEILKNKKIKLNILLKEKTNSIYLNEMLNKYIDYNNNNKIIVSKNLTLDESEFKVPNFILVDKNIVCINLNMKINSYVSNNFDNNMIKDLKSIFDKYLYLNGFLK